MKKHIFLIVTALVYFIFSGKHQDKQISRHPILKKRIRKPATRSQRPFSYRSPAQVQKRKELKVLTDRDGISKALKTYNEIKDYPNSSLPINKKIKSDQLLNKYKVSFSTGISSDKDSTLNSKTWTNKNYYYSGEEIVLSALVYDKGKRVKASATAEIYDEGRNLLKSISLNQSNDLSLKAKLNLNSENSQNYLINIKMKTSGSNSFIYSTNSINVRDKYSKYISVNNGELDANKDLVFTSKYSIYEKGNYQIQASLYNEEGYHLAYINKVVTLDRGINQIPISFYGNIFYKNKLSGPFILKNMVLNKVEDQNLDFIAGDLIQFNKLTESYNWNSFNSKSFNDPTITIKIDQINAYLRSH